MQTTCFSGETPLSSTGVKRGPNYPDVLPQDQGLHTRVPVHPQDPQGS